jgi:hypothetical protein
VAGGPLKELTQKKSGTTAVGGSSEGGLDLGLGLGLGLGLCGATRGRRQRAKRDAGLSNKNRGK